MIGNGKKSTGWRCQTEWKNADLGLFGYQGKLKNRNYKRTKTKKQTKNEEVNLWHSQESFDREAPYN